MRILIIIAVLLSWVKQFAYSFLQFTSKSSITKLYSFEVRKNNERPKFAIIGGGAFSLALAKVLSHKNIESKLLVRNETVAHYINQHRHHPKYLAQFMLPNVVSATHDPIQAFKDVNYIIHCIPMQSSRSYLDSIKHLIPAHLPIISATKGVEQNTHSLMSQVLAETVGNESRLAYLSGPSFAQEMMLSQATAVVIASTNTQLAKDLSGIISSPEFRVITSNDVKGVELGGAIKNVLALAAGMCEGLGLGMNAKSSLITRGCMEMASMGKLFGANPDTFIGLAGVGDTFATCFGPLSRNRKVGYRLAQGEALKDILATNDGVAEGVETVLALEQMVMTKLPANVFGFKFPIISGVARVVKGKLHPKLGMQILMRFPLHDEDQPPQQSDHHQ